MDLFIFVRSGEWYKSMQRVVDLDYTVVEPHLEIVLETTLQDMQVNIIIVTV